MEPLLFLDFLGELFSDANLVIKIFALLTIVSWIRNHVEDGPLAWIIMAGMGYFILFDGWAIFGPIYVLYMLLMFGVSAVVIDFFFVGGGGAPEVEGMESPVSTGIDIQKRMQGQPHPRQAGMRRPGG